MEKNDCLMKITSFKCKKYGVNQEIKYLDNVVFREVFIWIWLFFFVLHLFFTKNDLSLPLIFVSILILLIMKQSRTNVINLSFSLTLAGLLYRVEKSNVFTLLQEERGLDCMCSIRYLKYFSIHIWCTSP